MKERISSDGLTSLEGGLVKRALAALATAGMLWLGGPAQAAGAVVITEPTVWFTGSSCIGGGEQLRIEGTTHSTVVGDFKVIKTTITANRAVGTSSGNIYQVNFGFGTVFPPTGGMFNSTDFMTIVDPGTGDVAIFRLITHFRIDHDGVFITFETNLDRCV